MAVFAIIIGTNGFATAQELGTNTITVPLNFDYPGPIIETEINGKPARLMYDSGASHLIIFEQSFPELVPSTAEAETANVFGGNQTAAITPINPLTLNWNNIDVNMERPFLANYNVMISKTNHAPFFEGLMPKLKISNDKHESVTVFDAPNNKIIHMPIGKKPKFKKPKSFKLTRKDEWEWRVKMPVVLTGETKTRTLTLIVDTGLADSLILDLQT